MASLTALAVSPQQEEQGRSRSSLATSRRPRSPRGSLVQPCASLLLCFLVLSLNLVAAQGTNTEEPAEPTFKYVTSTMLSQFIVVFLIAVTAIIGLSCLSNIDVPEIYSNRSLDINKEY